MKWTGWAQAERRKFLDDYALHIFCVRIFICRKFLDDYRSAYSLSLRYATLRSSWLLRLAVGYGTNQKVFLTNYNGFTIGLAMIKVNSIVPFLAGEDLLIACSLRIS